MTNPDLAELIGKVAPDTEASLTLWFQGEDLHYAWFGFNREQIVAVLEKLARHVSSNTSYSLGPCPTKH